MSGEAAASALAELPAVTALVDERVFYVLPMVNPDGRQHWFEAPNTASSSRSGTRPISSPMRR